jgi:peptidoglycan lytic transglycosylase
MELSRCLGLAIFVTAVSVANADFALCQDTESEPAPVAVEEPIKPSENNIQTETGLAAYYHANFHGRRTANGESFDHNALTAAHKTLPFGTLVRVINLTNLRSVVVRVNDRGPLQKSRVIDLTRRAASVLGFLTRGMTSVKIEILGSNPPADSVLK